MCILHSVWRQMHVCVVQPKACESLTWCENEKILQPSEAGLLRSPC